MTKKKEPIIPDFPPPEPPSSAEASLCASCGQVSPRVILVDGSAPLLLGCSGCGHVWMKTGG